MPEPECLRAQYTWHYHRFIHIFAGLPIRCLFFFRYFSPTFIPKPDKCWGEIAKEKKAPDGQTSKNVNKSMIMPGISFFSFAISPQHLSGFGHWALISLLRPKRMQFIQDILYLG
jgi:hypothetical protein